MKQEPLLFCDFGVRILVLIDSADVLFSFFMGVLVSIGPPTSPTFSCSPIPENGTRAAPQLFFTNLFSPSRGNRRLPPFFSFPFAPTASRWAESGHSSRASQIRVLRNPPLLSRVFSPVLSHLFTWPPRALSEPTPLFRLQHHPPARWRLWADALYPFPSWKEPSHDGFFRTFFSLSRNVRRSGISLYVLSAFPHEPLISFGKMAPLRGSFFWPLPTEVTW